LCFSTVTLVHRQGQRALPAASHGISINVHIPDDYRSSSATRISSHAKDYRFATINWCHEGFAAARDHCGRNNGASHFATDTTLALMWSGLFVQRRFCWVVQWVPEDPWRRV